MRPILWSDCETTGLNKNKHGIIQIGCIVDMNGEVIDTFNQYMKPFKGDKINKDAMIKNNTTIDDLKHDPKFVDPIDAFENFIKFLEKHVNRYDKNDKFILAGKNLQFDIKFLRRFFEKCSEDVFYGSWFMYPYIDIEHTIAELIRISDDIKFPNFKLETLCDIFEIDIENTHNALDDIKATMDIYYKLVD